MSATPRWRSFLAGSGWETRSAWGRKGQRKSGWHRLRTSRVGASVIGRRLGVLWAAFGCIHATLAPRRAESSAEPALGLTPRTHRFLPTPNVPASLASSSSLVRAGKSQPDHSAPAPAPIPPDCGAFEAVTENAKHDLWSTRPAWACPTPKRFPQAMHCYCNPTNLPSSSFPTAPRAPLDIALLNRPQLTWDAASASGVSREQVPPTCPCPSSRTLIHL